MADVVLDLLDVAGEGKLPHFLARKLPTIGHIFKLFAAVIVEFAVDPCEVLTELGVAETEKPSAEDTALGDRLTDRVFAADQFEQLASKQVDQLGASGILLLKCARQCILQ